MPSQSAISTSFLLAADALGAVRGGRPLFHGVSFELHAGDILQVEGANGAGKTTLLNTIAGLSYIQSGRVSWCGQALPAARSVFCQSLAYLGHQHGLKAALTPLENLRWSLGVIGLPWHEAHAMHVLAGLGLADVAEQPAATLSAGQRRRVALARIFLSSKPLWILDEPLTALDRQVIPVVESRLRAHAENGGLILLTAHQAMSLGPSHRTLMLGAANA